jgi:hypothetical protein
MDKLYYGNMREHEIEAAKEVYRLIIGKHFTKSVSAFLIKLLEMATIIEPEKESEPNIEDPTGHIAGYIEPGPPYFGKPIVYTVTSNLPKDYKFKVIPKGTLDDD